MTSSSRRVRWTLIATLATAGVLPSVLAQEVAQPGMNPESMYGKESAQGVYVRDSAVALEKFAQAQRMERLKEWAKAADLYQEVLEKFADRVVPSQVDKNNNIYQYTSVIAAVQQKMSHWPADGLEVYRSRYESVAASMLDGARPDDRAAYQAVISKYFATDTAKTAGMRLMDLYFEAGEFPAASWLGELLLTQHPNLNLERPMVMYRCALAYSMEGNADKAKSILADLTAKYPQDLGTIRGQSQNLVASLTSELAQPVSRAQAVSDSSWPMFGGSASHAKLSTAAGRPGAKIASVELTKPTFKGLQADQISELKTRDHADQDSGATLGVMPVVDHGEMFFQDGQKIYAVNIESGQPLPGWLATNPGDRGGQYKATNVRFPPRTDLLTVTLTDRAVLAVIGQNDRFSQRYTGTGVAEGKLVCLDRTNGHENWVAQARDLPDEAQNLRTAEFTGSPLVVDDNVYIVARPARTAQFEDCYVICFDVATGKYKWNCYIASANSLANGTQFDGDVLAIPESTPQLGYASGRLYVLTNLGALAAVDAYGGRIVWLSIYQRDQSSPANGNALMQARINGGMYVPSTDKPWESNPVFIDNGKVFVLPADGKYLEIYDAGTGVEFKRLDPKHLAAKPDSNQSPDPATSLIAVLGSRLLVTGGTSIAYVDWAKYDIDKFAAKRDPMIVWPRAFKTNIRGRAFVANDRVFIPTVERMLVMSLKGWRVVEDFPSSNKSGKGWDEKDGGDGAGNIVVSDDDVIVAGNRHVNVYTNLDAARQKVEKEIADNPAAVEPRKKYAELMFNAGDTAGGIAKLDDATAIASAQNNFAPGPARDSLYNVAMSNAEKLSHDVKDAANASVSPIQQLYDRASTSASSPIQQVNYRMRRAKFSVTIKDFPTAVKLYQQLIASPDWRVVPVRDDTSNGQLPAGLYARQQIDELIHTAGPICYAVFEQEALQQFTAAKANGQIDAMVNIAASYPNAKVAAPALLAAADLKDAGGDHRGAVQLLRQLYLSYPNTADKQKVLESLARNYLGIPNRTNVAAARLTEATKLGGDAQLSQPLPLPDGRTISNVSFSLALVELKKASGVAQARALPNFNLPIPNFLRTAEGKKKYREPFAVQSGDTTIANVQNLVVPSAEFQRVDRIAAFVAGDGLSIYAPGGSQPLVKLPATDLPGLAWTPRGPMIWTAAKLMQLKGDSSDAAWAFDVKAAPAVEVAAIGDSGDDDNATDAKTDAQPDEVNVVVQQGNMNGRVFINNGGRIRMINRRQNNPPLVLAPRDGESITTVRPIGDTVLVTTSTARLVVLEAADGKLRWQTRLPDRPPERELASEDFVVVTQRDENNLVTMTVFDTFSGQVIGRRTFDDGFHVPINLVLSPDGMLVYTLPDRIVIKNLYEPWGNTDREIIDQKAVNSGQFPYVNQTMPDQLQVVDDRILALSDLNMSLRVFSMESGKPLRYTPVDSNKEIDLVLQTGNRQPQSPVMLRLVGSQVYLIGQQSLISYDLDHPAHSWRGTPASERDRTVDAFAGQKHLVELTDVTTKHVNGNKVGSYILCSYGRYPATENDTAECGILDYRYAISDPAGIIGFQAVEGGFYYLTGDQKLHFLKGLGS